MKYAATIQHHSISRARQILIDGTLAKACRQASEEFGDEQRDYNIVVYELGEDGLDAPNKVAWKRVASPRWQFPA